jgi:hypothetical protein
MWRNPSSEGPGVMKVVLSWAGYGMRIRTAEGDLIPKPLQMVGLADYADVVTDAPLDTMSDRLKAGGAAASMLIMPPQSSFHCVDVSADGDIKEIAPTATFPIWVNGVYFVLTHEIFDLIPENGDLVGDACMALAGIGRSWVTSTTASGSRPTHSKSTQNWTPTTTRDCARGWCGKQSSARRSA